MVSNRVIVSLIVFFSFLLSSIVTGQEEQKEDTAKVQVVLNDSAKIDLEQDSLQRHTGLNPLDIPNDRGLYVISSDRLMQLRILGSIRALFTFNDRKMDDVLGFNPFEIPVENAVFEPRVDGVLKQSRLAFEVSRRTEKGDVFIRLESDFANEVNSFRIRHAYGQYRFFIVGQTWSLFSCVTNIPATVSNDGPAGSMLLRTPQVRFYKQINDTMSWFVGVEYSKPEVFAPDSITRNLFQLVPDLTARIDYQTNKIKFQVSVIVSAVSGNNANNKLAYFLTYGLTFSLKSIINKNRLYFLAVGGKSISHYISMFQNKNLDAFFNPLTNSIEPLYSLAGYFSYQYDWLDNLFSSISVGYGGLYNKDIQVPNAYKNGYNILVNTIWNPIRGCRIGLEYAFGQRFNLDNNSGYANRVSVLVHYDF